MQYIFLKYSVPFCIFFILCRTIWSSVLFLSGLNQLRRIFLDFCDCTATSLISVWVFPDVSLLHFLSANSIIWVIFHTVSLLASYDSHFENDALLCRLLGSWQPVDSTRASIGPCSVFFRVVALTFGAFGGNSFRQCSIHCSRSHVVWLWHMWVLLKLWLCSCFVYSTLLYGLLHRYQIYLTSFVSHWVPIVVSPSFFLSTQCDSFSSSHWLAIGDNCRIVIFMSASHPACDEWLYLMHHLVQCFKWDDGMNDERYARKLHNFFWCSADFPCTSRAFSCSLSSLIIQISHDSKICSLLTTSGTTGGLFLTRLCAMQLIINAVTSSVPVLSILIQVSLWCVQL